MTMTYTEAEAWLALEAKHPGLVKASTIRWIWQAVELRFATLAITRTAA